MPFHDFLEENHCCFAVASLGNKGFQHFSFVVDGTPQVMCFAIDFDKNFIQMPSPVGMIPGRMKSFLRISPANIGPNLFHQYRTVS